MNAFLAILSLPIVYLVLCDTHHAASALSIGPATPDLWALAATGVLLCGGAPRRYWIASTIGLLSDLDGFGRLGLAAIVYLVVGYCVTRSPRRFLSALLVRLAAAWPVALLLCGGVSLLQLLLGESTRDVFESCSIIICTSLYTAALSCMMLLVWHCLAGSDAAALRR